MKRTKRIKWAIALLVIAMSISMLGLLAGCVDEPDKSKTDPGDTPEVDEPKSEPSKEEPPKSDDYTIKIGKPFFLDENEIVLHEVKLGKDWDGKDIIILEFDFTNNSDEDMMPTLGYSIKYFQNGIELDSTPLSDDLDLGIGQKTIKPGITMNGVQAGAILEDTSVVTVEFAEFFSFDNTKYTLEVDPTTL
jgi:hypothetical protein